MVDVPDIVKEVLAVECGQIFIDCSCDELVYIFCLWASSMGRIHLWAELETSPIT